MTESPHLRMAASVPLSAAEHQVADQARAYVARLAEDGPAYLRRHALDPAIWMPGGGWDLSRPFYDHARSLLRGEGVDDLRLKAGQFTGYLLTTMANFVGTATHIDEPDDILRAVYRRNISGLPPWLQFSPPEKFGERGWFVEADVLMNYDTVACLERMAILYHCGVLDRLRAKPSARILEIGGGYGALAFALLRSVPSAQYAIVDLPESLIYSAIYLSVLTGWGSCRFLANYEFPALVASGARFDLVINTLSMSEMTEEQVRAYCSGIRELIEPDGVFFEQNQDNRHLGMLNAQDVIAPYFGHCTALGGPGQSVQRDQGYAHLWKR